MFYISKDCKSNIDYNNRLYLCSPLLLYNFFFPPGPDLWHMEFPRLGVKLELQLPAYTTATATWDPSHVFDLHHSSWQRPILNPLSEARDRTCILMDTSQILNLLSHNGNSSSPFSVFGCIPKNNYNRCFTTK